MHRRESVQRTMETHTTHILLPNALPNETSESGSVHSADLGLNLSQFDVFGAEDVMSIKKYHGDGDIFAGF